MHPELLDRLRADLREANYRASTVAALLGAEADAARLRGVFAPALRVLEERGPSPLATLVACFLLGERLPESALDDALPGLGASGAEALGLVTRLDRPGVAADSGLGYAAALSLGPVSVDDARSAEPFDWWIISDLDDQLRRGPARPDHVMGVGGATRSLISQAPPTDVGSALDLGTGCGIVALHLALRGEVVATDISERALAFARANAYLNGAEGIEFRHGDLFEPVAGGRFDLILSNPPFVISPRAGGDVPVYEYRDGGMTGDELAASVVREAPRHLADGGALLCLANWESPWGEPGLARVRTWIEDAATAAGPLDAWVIERDRVSPVQYAETWARDGGARAGDAEFEAMMTEWLGDFAERRIVAVGLGSVRVRRRDGASGSVIHIDEAGGALAPGAPGASLAAAFDAGAEAGRMGDGDVLAAHWILSDAVVEDREHRPGEEAPRALTLRTDRPIARRVTADPLLAAAVGACDGELTLAQIADALATLLEVDAGAAREALVAGVRELAWLGMLAPGAEPE